MYLYVFYLYPFSFAYCVVRYLHKNTTISTTTSTTNATIHFSGFFLPFEFPWVSTSIFLFHNARHGKHANCLLFYKSHPTATRVRRLKRVDSVWVNLSVANLFILYLKFSPSQHPECVNPSALSVSMAILLFFKSHPGGVPLANCNTFASHLQDLVCIDILNLPFYTELCSSAFIVSHQYGAHQTFCVKVLSVFSFVFILCIYLFIIQTHDFCR